MTFICSCFYEERKQIHKHIHGSLLVSKKLLSEIENA